jgi:hypothetical protein
VIGLLGLTGVPTASAHEGGREAEGYVMVQQAIAYLNDMPEPEASMHAKERVAAALAASDQEGVHVETLKQAQTALQAGDTGRAGTLLQDSIADAVKTLAPAKGQDTGTGTVLPPLGAQHISALGSAFLALSLAAIIAGVWLAALFRPRETVRELRKEMGLASRHLDIGHDGTKGQKR